MRDYYELCLHCLQTVILFIGVMAFPKQEKGLKWQVLKPLVGIFGEKLQK